MQLVLCNNRIVAHGENFLAIGGVVINTETGKRYDNATVAECENCPSDIDSVGYEYHGGVFVPCAPFGKGNNNGYFMEVCADCATPRSSGIPIKGGLSCENLGELLWENATTGNFDEQTVSIQTEGYAAFIIVFQTNNVYSPKYVSLLLSNSFTQEGAAISGTGVTYGEKRTAQVVENGIKISGGFLWRDDTNSWSSNNDWCMKPLKIYGVNL